MSKTKESSELPSPKRPEENPEKPRLRERVGEVAERFKNAWEKAAKDKDVRFRDRVIIFFSEFLKDTKSLTLEQEKIDQQECEKIGEVLKNADAKTLAYSTKQEVFGQNISQLTKDENEVVDVFLDVSSETFKKNINNKEQIEVARTFDIINGKTSAEYMTNERRLLAGYYGIKTAKGLKLYFKQKGFGIDEIEKQFNTFENALKKGVVTRGNFKALFDISFNPLDIISLKSNSVASLIKTLPDKGKSLALSLSGVDWGDKSKVRPALEKLLPATKANPQVMNDIVDIIVNVKTAGRRPTNREIATLMFNIEVSDFDYLANLVHA